MSDKKHIDRLFQEKFKDFEVAPNDALWERINNDLPKKKKKRRIIALWWQIGGVAAVIALLFSIGISVNNSDDNHSQKFPIVDTEPNHKKDDQKLNTTNSISNIEENRFERTIGDTKKIADFDLDTKTSSTPKTEKSKAAQRAAISNLLTTGNKSQVKINSVTNASKRLKKMRSDEFDNSNNETTKVALNASNSNPKQSVETTLAMPSEIRKTIKNNKTAIAANTSSKPSDTETHKIGATIPIIGSIEDLLENTENKASIEEAIADSEALIEKEDKQSRWSISPNVAPVYFNSFGNGSSIDNQFNENPKGGDINMSYGITGSYAISKRIKIRGGINRVNLNQRTSDVIAFTGADNVSRGTDAQLGNITFKKGMDSVSIMSSEIMNTTSTPELFNTKTSGDIDQRFGFIEVPLEIEYRLLDKKLGINVIGGFSTFLLSDNEIYADIDGNSTLIGEANNINNTSFSANFGLGMDYNISKQWSINLEPTFKYQINTFNNTASNFRPFFIGVYTGLSFRFD